MYVFVIVKSNASSDEEYESALGCARASVESVLEDECVDVSLAGGEIVIKAKGAGHFMGLSMSRCKEMIKGCFCDSEGELYPEFCLVRPDDRS